MRCAKCNATQRDAAYANTNENTTDDGSKRGSIQAYTYSAIVCMSLSTFGCWTYGCICWLLFFRLRVDSISIQSFLFLCPRPITHARTTIPRHRAFSRRYHVVVNTLNIYVDVFVMVISCIFPVVMVSKRVQFFFAFQLFPSLPSPLPCTNLTRFSAMPHSQPPYIRQPNNIFYTTIAYSVIYSHQRLILSSATRRIGEE